MSQLDLPVTPPRLAAGAVPVPAQEVFAIAQEYFEAGRIDAAERMLGHVLAAAPDQPDALHLRGLIAFRRNRHAEAAVLIERSIAAGGQRPVHWRNLSEVLRLLARPDQALAAARRAIALDPADALGLFNLAMVHYDRVEIAECIAAARASLDLKPDLPQTHMKLAQAMLLSGDLTPGWEHYEWRYRIPGAPPLMPPTERPQWDGAELGAGRRLLLVADQGYGDVVMFARYIPWVMERCWEIVVACSPEVVALIEAMFPGLSLATRWEDVPEYSCFCPLSGLPRLHGTTLATIPQGFPYLTPDAARALVWRERLDRMVPGSASKRVGLVWAGRPTHNNDINRSTTLAALGAITAVPGAAFISLQKGPAAAEAARQAGPATLIDLSAEIDGFDDTAAVIAGLDLVIGVDTAVLHIAGAMGRRAWILLPYAPDWRWLLARADSPWYPGLRLFRSPEPRDWAAVTGEVARALEGFVTGA